MSEKFGIYQDIDYKDNKVVTDFLYDYKANKVESNYWGLCDVMETSGSVQFKRELTFLPFLPQRYRGLK